jgi:hypothetical protein
MWAAVEMQPQLRDVAAERRLELLEELTQTLLRLADREVAVRLARARDRVRPHLVRLERQTDRRECRERRIDVHDAGDDQVLLACQPDVAAERLDEVGDGDQLVARGKAERYGKADIAATVLLRVHADVRGGLRTNRRQVVPLERSAEPRLDALEHALRADVVDHELEPRLHARHPVLQILAPDRRDGAEDLVRLLLRNEDAEIACNARNRRQAAADLHGIALTAVVDRTDERDTVDLRRVAAVGARRDRVLVLAREIRPGRIAVELLGRCVDDRGRVEELVRGDAAHRAAGDVADGVTAAAGARDS